jgi:hypothetical protein
VICTSCAFPGSLGEIEKRGIVGYSRSYAASSNGQSRSTVSGSCRRRPGSYKWYALKLATYEMYGCYMANAVIQVLRDTLRHNIIPPQLPEISNVHVPPAGAGRSLGFDLPAGGGDEDINKVVETDEILIHGYLTGSSRR